MGSGESCRAALITPETGGLGSGIGSGESCRIALIIRVIGGLGSGIGSGESCRVRVKGLALAANRRSAIDAKRTVCFSILEKISLKAFSRVC